MHLKQYHDCFNFLNAAQTLQAAVFAKKRVKIEKIKNVKQYVCTQLDKIEA